MREPKGRRSQPALRDFAEALGVTQKSLERLWVRYDECEEPIVPGRAGCLYAYDVGQLGVVVGGVARVKRALERKEWEPIAGVYDDGHRGLTEEAFVAPISDIEFAAKIIGAFRRRAPLPEKERERLRRQLARARKPQKS